MKLQEAQENIDQWIKTTGVRYFNELTNTAILMEEVGEVARIMARKYGEQSFKKSDENHDLGDELADIIVRRDRLGLDAAAVLVVKPADEANLGE